MRVLPYGDRALLAEVDDHAQAMALARALERDRDRVPGVVELVPGARTVLVRIDPAATSLHAVGLWLERTTPGTAPPAPPRVVRLPVRYDGADLAATAELLGVTPDELIRRHTAQQWTAAFSGFAPGFAYLVATDWFAEIPRLATSRERVPPGAVAVAGEFSGVYPRASPGGWRILGTTSSVLWDADSPAPALIPPGTAVRFDAVTG